MRPSGFSFTTTSAIPNSMLELGKTRFEKGKLLDIRPMQGQGHHISRGRGRKLRCEQSLTVARNGSAVDLKAEGWKVTARTANVPKALWGTGSASALSKGTDQLVKNQLVGFEVAAPAAHVGASAGPLNANALVPTPLMPSGVLPLGSGPPQGPTACADADGVQAIESTIAAAPVASARAALVDALAKFGIGPLANDDMTPYATSAGTLFTAEPLLVAPSASAEGRT